MNQPAEDYGESIVSKEDVENQRIAEFQYNRHLRALGVTQLRTEPTPEHRMLCYDLCVYEEGKWTGVIEVRSVNYRHDEIEEFGGFLMDTQKLKGLKQQFHSISPVSGKGFWSKEIVFLYRCVKDDTLWAINMYQIVKHWTEWKDVPNEWLKDYRGKSMKEAKQIPFNMMERVE